MTDPAVEAWRRSSARTSPLDALGAIEEMLKLIRGLHYPVTCAALTPPARYKTVCAHCHRHGFYTTEPEFGDWPCDTAKLIYATEELGA
jgi:hypothetical protein